MSRRRPYAKKKRKEVPTCPHCGHKHYKDWEQQIDTALGVYLCVACQKAFPVKAKAHKYGAKKVERAGMWFDSKFEASVYDILVWRQKAGEITELKCQDEVSLTRAGIIYKPDFRYNDMGLGRTVWAEAKGYESPVWPLKLRLWGHYGPGRLEIWKGDYRKPRLWKIVEPKVVL